MDDLDRLDRIKTKLRTRGYRITPQRLAVVDTLVKSNDHPSVEQIYERVRIDFPTTSLATIYKTIAVLKEIEEVLELGIGNDSKHYDGVRPSPHPHLICIRCGSIIDLDIDLDDLSQLAQRVSRDTGYEILSQRFDFVGICPGCRQLKREKEHGNAEPENPRRNE